jgi:ankyrin repeat protein
LLGQPGQNEVYDNSIEKKLPGTCEWLLSRAAFSHWLSSDFRADAPKIFWMHGSAGIGKTILCASVVDYLKSRLNTPLAYFFFSSDFETRGDPFRAMRSWIAQLSSYTRSFEVIRDNWAIQYEQMATQSGVSQLLQYVVQEVPGCTLVIDGLDECTWFDESRGLENKALLANFLGTLLRAISNTKTRVMVVSRDEPDIRQGLTCKDNEDFVEYKISPTDLTPDITSYSRSIVERKLPNKSEDIKQDISTQMSERCNGQFLWLKLQEDHLRGWKNKKQLEDVINRTPSGLESLYDRNWSQILHFPESRRDRAISLLRWAAFSLRPLTIAEVTEALLVSVDSEDILVDELPDYIDDDYINSEIRSLCGSLIEIRSTSSDSHKGLQTIHLTHYSIKQFLVSKILDRHFSLDVNTHSSSASEGMQSLQLAKVCVKYINNDRAWKTEPALPKNREFQVEGAFREYAASSWYKHISVSSVEDEDLVQLINSFFNLENNCWKKWRAWFVESSAKTKSQFVQKFTPGGSPLYYAGLLGLVSTVRYLIHKGDEDINEKFEGGITTLAATCLEGNLRISEILIEAGAVPNSDKTSWTPLTTAAQSGNTEIVSLLLKHGASIQGSSDNKWSPLHEASNHGHTAVAKLLIEAGADVALVTEGGWTPISTAANNGHSATVSILIEKGSELNHQGQNGVTPLYLASSAGHLETVSVLLQNGADHTLMTRDGWRPLSVASYYGYYEIVKLLLDRGADPDLADKRGSDSLCAAATTGHLEIVNLLLQYGADVNGNPKFDWSPLQLAVRAEHDKVISLLLQKGANFRATDTGWTPLMSAANQGQTHIVKLFLDSGADIEATSNAGSNALFTAAKNGRQETVKFLVERGANVNATADGETALHMAIGQRNLEVGEFLHKLYDVQHLRAPNIFGRTALFTAARVGSVEFVRLLLARDTQSLLYKDYLNAYPLFAAVRNGHENVVEILLDADSTVIDATDAFGRTPMWWAKKGKYENIVRLLNIYAKKIGILISEVDDPMESSLKPFNPGGAWCDACTLSIPGGDRKYLCKRCYMSTFCLCADCYEFGLRCMETSHELEMVDPLGVNNPEANTVE